MPRLVPGWEEKCAELSPEQGFLISRIDGATSWGMLRRICGMAPEQADDCLERCLQAGLIVLEPGAASGGPARARRESATDDVLDPALDLSVELQKQVIEFEKALDKPYHELLGVARDASERDIKRAYFGLSKVFHPDRYFGRRTGPFGERLDRIFKKLAIAYELLIDPATRAEVQRGLPEEPSPPPEPGRPPRKPTKQEWLSQMRRRFRIPEEVASERRFKARQFAEAGRVAQHQQRWIEAASSIRLAIAFDPWTDEYKEDFGQVQAEVNRLRAERLLEEAGGAWDASASAEALRLLDEAIHYRPSDPDIHHRAARVALEVEDFDRAGEYAERACELAPEVAEHQLTLGQVLRRQGLREKSRAAFERARQLAPDDARIQQELARLRPRPGRSGGGMR